jgi:hypothetical protein
MGDDRNCRDGSIDGFGRRLAQRFAADTAIPDDMLALLTTLDEADVVKRPAPDR